MENSFRIPPRETPSRGWNFVYILILTSSSKLIFETERSEISYRNYLNIHMVSGNVLVTRNHCLISNFVSWTSRGCSEIKWSGKNCTSRSIEQSILFPIIFTDILLNDEIILGPTFYLAEYILQVVRYADPGTATKFARFQNPHVPHPVQLVLRVDIFQFRQYRIRHVHVFLIRIIMQ